MTRATRVPQTGWSGRRTAGADEVRGEDVPRVTRRSVCLVPSPGACCSCTRRRARCARTSSGPPAASSACASAWTGRRSRSRPACSAPSCRGRPRPAPAPRLTSALRGWAHLRYEVTEEPSRGVDGGRWSHTPELGIFHAVTDVHGNVMVPEDRIRAAVEAGAGDPAILRHELDLALGAGLGRRARAVPLRRRGRARALAAPTSAEVLRRSPTGAAAGRSRSRGRAPTSAG